jgi:protein involved in polysaccharide export with SLBB domain
MNWFMLGNGISALITGMLVFQLILGPGEFAFGQGLGGGAGAAPGQAPGPGAQGPKGAGKAGVKSAEVEEESIPGGQALSRAVLPEKYVLGPGDGLSINFLGDYEESQTVKVTPDGKIVLPSIGDIAVTGLTLAEAEALVATEARRRYRTILTSVSLASLRVFQVLVLGEVQNPGTYLATPVRRVSELINKAGDVLPSGSARHIELRREGRLSATADLYAFLRKGDESANPYVSDGDVILVPPMGESRVVAYVSEVSTGIGGALTENSVPFAIEVKEGERLSTVIDQVGGVSPWWDLQGVFIVREMKIPEGTMRIPADLRRNLRATDDRQNPVVAAGDQVFVPASIRRVFVAGFVKAPGAYSYFPNRTADAYLSQAGGAAITADFGRSFIKRADGTVEPYLGTAEINQGDTIVVMEKLFRTYMDYVAFFSAISGVLFGLFGFAALLGTR